MVCAPRSVKEDPISQDAFMRYFSHWIHITLTVVMTSAILPTVLPASAQNSSFSSRWNSWFRSAPPPRPGTGRGDGFCPVAVLPGQANAVWNEHPVLTWLGSVEKMELRAVNNADVVWDYTPKDADRVSAIEMGNRPMYSVALSETLQPDVTYELRVYDQPDVEPMSVNLRLSTALEREQITQDLQQIDQSVQTGTREAASLKRAEYFASKNLWSSFWQTLLSVQPPSPELKELMQATLTEVCPED